jgi:heme ABC exporter ATP-binding subunit CcmA
MICARKLAKRFGERTVLAPLDLDLALGETLVVTGANGAGKTTLLRLLVGLSVASSGELEVSVDRSRLGYVAHEPLLYRDLTAWENLALYARLYRVARAEARIDELLDRYGLATSRSERVRSFSRGMTQRLALCRALLHDPSLVVLDEPHAALDADGGATLDAELADMHGRAAIVIATHAPSRVAALATTTLHLERR